MVEGVGEVLVGHELEQETADVLVGVGRDLVLFVVALLGQVGLPEDAFLYYFLSFFLLL